MAAIISATSTGSGSCSRYPSRLSFVETSSSGLSRRVGSSSRAFLSASSTSSGSGPIWMLPLVTLLLSGWGRSAAVGDGKARRVGLGELEGDVALGGPGHVRGPD